MSPNTFFTPLNGQSLLYPGQSEIYRGQCVQSVLLWLEAIGTNPPIYASAYQYFTKGVPGYVQVQKGQPINEGDIIVWGSNFPPAIFDGVGNGHIDVADSPGTIQSFSAWDSNWAPLVLKRILHNGSDNNYILGYLRKEGDTMDDQDVMAMYLAAGKSEADATSQANLDYYRGKKPEQLAHDLYKGNNTGNPSYFYMASHYEADVKAAAAQGTNRDSALAYVTKNLK